MSRDDIGCHFVRLPDVDAHQPTLVDEPVQDTIRSGGQAVKATSSCFPKQATRNPKDGALPYKARFASVSCIAIMQYIFLSLLATAFALPTPAVVPHGLTQIHRHHKRATPVLVPCINDTDTAVPSTGVFVAKNATRKNPKNTAVAGSSHKPIASSYYPDWNADQYPVGLEQRMRKASLIIVAARDVGLLQV
jgi:hypothetical protein